MPNITLVVRSGYVKVVHQVSGGYKEKVFQFDKYSGPDKFFTDLFGHLITPIAEGAGFRVPPLPNAPSKPKPTGSETAVTESVSAKIDTPTVEETPTNVSKDEAKPRTKVPANRSTNVPRSAKKGLRKEGGSKRSK
jgi:hypothetical protein